MITSDQAKTAVILGVAAIGLYFGLKIYGKVSAAGDAMANWQKHIADAAHEADTEVNRAIQSARNFIADKTGLVTGDTSSVSNPDFVAPDYVTEIPFSKWPQSVKDEINTLNRTRGISREWKYAGDFTGWKYFSNGTIVSPDGYYASENSVNTANEYDSGVMVIPNNFTGLTFDQTKYQWQEAQ